MTNSAFPMADPAGLILFDSCRLEILSCLLEAYLDAYWLDVPYLEDHDAF